MKQTIFILSLLLLSSCGLLKLKLIKGGEVKQEEFYSVISFERVGGLPIVTAKINGEKVRCLFDTGAPNVISPELAAKLSLKAKSSTNVKDSGGQKEKQDMVVLDSVNLGGVVFNDLAAIVTDLKGSDVLACLGVDAIIGANLMRLAFWEINYEELKMTFTNELSKLADRSSMSVMNFTPKITGTPYVDIKINGQLVKSVTFDTGSTGHIDLAHTDFKTIKLSSEKSNVLYEFGSTSFGVFGMAKSDSSYYCKIDSLIVGDGFELSSSVVEFSGKSRLLGNRVLENYTVIMDWEESKIYLAEKSPYTYNSVSSFGFKYYFHDRKVFIGSLIMSPELEDELKIGDQILRINDDDFENIEDDQYCPFMFNEERYAGYGDEIAVKVKRGEEIIDLVLKKKTYLE